MVKNIFIQITCIAYAYVMHSCIWVQCTICAMCTAVESHTSKLSTSKIMQMENAQAFLWQPFSTTRFIATPDTRKTHSPYHEWLTHIPFEWIVSIFALLKHVLPFENCCTWHWQAYFSVNVARLVQWMLAETWNSNSSCNFFPFWTAPY